MPTTTNYGFYSPPLTGVTPNIPRDSKTLADAVDVALKAEENARVAGVADLAGKIGSPSVDVIATALQSMANAAEVTITFAAATSNPDGMWALGGGSTPSGNITIPAGAGGLYDFKFTYSFAANTTGVRIMLIKVNGVSVRSWRLSTDASGLCCGVIPWERRLSAGDVVTLSQYQSSGGALNTTNQSYPAVQAHRVAA